jgi:hypothetical protein
MTVIGGQCTAENRPGVVKRRWALTAAGGYQAMEEHTQHVAAGVKQLAAGTVWQALNNGRQAAGGGRAQSTSCGWQAASGERRAATSEQSAAGGNRAHMMGSLSIA